jgi:hypothetical protein
LRAGERALARTRCAESRTIVEATGIGGFIAAPLCACEALLADDPATARAVLAEGEGWLARGSLGHCHFWYRADAIDVALALRDHELALHHCVALEAYASAEPLPWSDFHIARGRAMVAFARAPGEAERGALAEVRERARALGFKGALPALDKALSR